MDQPPKRMGRPKMGRPRKRFMKEPQLQTDDMEGIYLVARAEGKRCITLLECSGAICREIGRFCVGENPQKVGGLT